MSMRCSGYSVRCDICEEYCSWERSRSIARESAKRAGWFRQRNDTGKMIDVCPDCHYRQVIERQQAAERAEEWAKAPRIEF